MFVTSQHCISAQHTNSGYDVTTRPEPPTDRHFFAIEPTYPFIPAATLRRMGKLVRMGLGSAMPLLQNHIPSAIIIATANAGKNDCVNFLNQIIEFDEGMLTPLHFVQSTPNSLAGHIGLLTTNRSYNITHVHLGHAFENALLDTQMFLEEQPGSHVLLGGADDLNSYHELYELKSGWVKQDFHPGDDFLNSNTPGSVHGEAAAMFMVSDNSKNAILKIKAIEIWDGPGLDELTLRINRFFSEQKVTQKTTVLFSGENGDNRLNPYYHIVDGIFEESAVFRYKLACGEFPTATSFALWLAGETYSQKKWPLPLLKKGAPSASMQNILIYNTYKGIEHSLILAEPVY